MPRIVKTPDERRTELITTAQQLFFSKGYERTSVNDIVKEVGVAKGTFYHYFDSKTAVLQALVDETVQQTQTILHQIIIDDNLSAVDKWQQAMQATGSWKFEHKEEMIELKRWLMMDENVLFEHKLRKHASKMMAIEFARIISQGVDEGMFTTQFIEEEAEIIVTILASLSDTLGDLLLNPDKYDDPLALALRQITAVQTAVERILGAPPGSCPVVGTQALTAWFTD